MTQKKVCGQRKRLENLESPLSLHQKLQLNGPVFGWSIIKFHNITKKIANRRQRTYSKTGKKYLRDMVSLDPILYQRTRGKNALKCYHAFIKGVHKLTFCPRTIPHTERSLKNTVTMIKEKLIPNITGRGQYTAADSLNKGGSNILTPDDRSKNLYW